MDSIEGSRRLVGAAQGSGCWNPSLPKIEALVSLVQAHQQSRAALTFVSKLKRTELL